MGWFSDIWDKAKDIVTDTVDFVVDIFKAAVDIVASPFKMPDMGAIGDGTSGQVSEQI